MSDDNPLINAVRAGNVAEVRSQARNFDINALDKYKVLTALGWAAYYGHTEVVKLLLTLNADVNRLSSSRGTPLMEAAKKGHTEIIRVLLKVPGVLVNHADNANNNALIYAANAGHTEAVKALLEVPGIDINHRSNDGRNSIECAKTEEIKNLLRVGHVPPPRPSPPPRTIVPPRPDPPPRPVVLPPRPSRSYVGSAIMSFRDTSRSVLASGRSLAAHAAATDREEAAAQELALRLDALCQRGQFRDLSAVTRVLAKPTGQSVVFEGVYKGQPVAVKVFRDKTTKDTAAKEVAYLQRCAHQHVLRVLKMYEYNERAILVMPMARGDLNGVIDKAEGPLPYDQVTEYVKQVATALVFLHDEKRVAHLDLKAGNVFIAKSDGRALLADFGMAMDITGSGDQLLNCGTPLFMAPELWAQRLSEPVQRGNRAKVDVYAFGCMVWQLLTRQLPFQRECENDGWGNDNFLRLATAVRRERRSPGDQLEDRWPASLRRVIQACCAHDPDRRPTMTQLLSAAEYLR